MSHRHRRSSVIGIAVVAATLMVAACGSDSADPPSTAAGTTVSATAGTAAGTAAGTSPDSAPTVGSGGTSAATSPGTPSTGGGSAGCAPADTSLDSKHGAGAGLFKASVECADESPLKAEGDPVVIGFQNSEGDPAGSFPEYSFAAKAAVDYINNELGGLGADVLNGKPGRPIKLEVCKMAISPDDSQRCANELSAKRPTLVYSSINFFGNQYPIYAAAKIPVVAVSAISIADFTSPGVFAIGTGGGCLGAHTALVKYAAVNLGGRRIAVPWADTPPGVTCYYDLEAKPLDVLNGSVEGSSKLAGTIPDLTYLGVPIKPATPDISGQVTQVLNFKPDVIIWSGQSADCWNLVSGLGRLGWTPKSIPLVLSGACINFDSMKAAKDLANGVYFVGSLGTILNDPTTIEDPFAKFEANLYQTKPSKYGMPADQLKKNYAVQGVASLMELWELSAKVVADGGELDSATMESAFADTAGQHYLGSPPISCSTAPTPYISVCATQSAISKWDGTQLVPVEAVFDGADLVAGTKIKTGP